VFNRVVTHDRGSGGSRPEGTFGFQGPWQVLTLMLKGLWGQYFRRIDAARGDRRNALSECVQGRKVRVLEIRSLCSGMS